MDHGGLNLHLACLVVDARNAVAHAPVWSDVLGAPAVESSPERTRLTYPGLTDFFLDFVPVPVREPRPHRIPLDLAAGDLRDEVVQRALAAGVAHVDIG